MVLFDIIGKTPEDWAHILREPNPSRIVKGLAYSVKSLVKSSSQIPNIRPLKGRAIMNSFLDSGIVISERGASSRVRKGKGDIIIHWPSLLRACDRLFDDPRYLGITSFVLGFLPIFKALSFTLAELFQRKALTGYYRAYNSGLNGYRYPLSLAENELLSQLLEGALTHVPAFSRALTRSCLATYQGVVMPKTVTVPLRKVEAIFAEHASTDLHPDLTQDFSLFFGEDILGSRNLHHRLTTRPVLEGISRDDGPFGTPDVKSFLSELLYACDAHLPLYNAHHQQLFEETGVRRFVFDDDSEINDIRVVDMQKFIAYRRPQHSKEFLSLLTATERKVPNTLRNEHIIKHFVGAITAKYSTLVPLQFILREREMIALNPSMLSPRQPYALVDEPYLLVFTRDWLNSLLKLKQQTDNGRLVASLSRKTVTRKRESTPRRLTERAMVDDGNFVDITYGFYYGRVIMTYPYHFDEDYKYRDIRRKRGRVTDKILRDGVFYFESLNEWFYSYAFLKDTGGVGLVRHPALNEFLYDLSRISSRDFRVKWQREHSKRKSSKEFTLAEDRMIIDYYRPRMSQDTKMLLSDVCVGRTSAEISRRATFLRRKLIEEGIFDINKLPHANYNVNIHTEIVEAQRLRGIDAE